MNDHRNKLNPKAVLHIGCWTFTMETRRMKIRSAKDVRSSDTGEGGRGTILRTENHSMRMTIHTVDITSAKGARIHLSVCIQGKRTTCTRTVPSDRTDVDGNPEKDVKTSYSVKQASEMLARILRIDAATAIKAILSPLPEDQDETNEYSDVRILVEA